MFLKKGQGAILVFNLAYLLFALVIFGARKNYEFIFYIGIIVLILALIISTNKRVDYPNQVLWLLSFWGLIHMLGGLVLIGENSRLYDIILINLSETYSIFRYDQFVHIIGFGVATLIMFILLKSQISSKIKHWTSLGIVVVMAGLGVGGLNEIIEFIATVISPETGVGGYINTSMDLVSDLVGAIIAFVYIKIKDGKI
jgi:uncharacterized membrane protein YjdF